MRHDVAKRLKRKTLNLEFVSFHGIGGVEPAEWRCLRQVTISSSWKEAPTITVTSLDKSFITRATPATKTSFSSGLISQGLQLADQRYITSTNLPEDIEGDLLIGADCYWHIVMKSLRPYGNGLVAVASKVDWLLSGPAKGAVTSETPKIVSILLRTLCRQPKPFESVSEQDPNLSVFWELEHIGIKDTHKEWDPYDQIFQQPNRIYLVHLPWNTNKTRLQSNRALAEGSLRSLLRRLNENQSLLHEYHR